MSRIIIGYSGHSYVAIEAAESNGTLFDAYCENEEKSNNPYDLKYLGNETKDNIDGNQWFVGIGNNTIRRKIIGKFKTERLLNCIHTSAQVSRTAMLETGILVAANSVINPLAKIGMGVICNTGSIIEHECIIGDYAHIAPGAVLAGNVNIGENCFVGARSVIREGIKIGNNSIIGAGAVIVKDVPENVIIIGNPGKILKK